MVMVADAVLLAASLAVTVMRLSSPQWRGRLEIVQVSVPETVPLPPRLLVQVTLLCPHGTRTDFSRPGTCRYTTQRASEIIAFASKMELHWIPVLV